MEGSLRYLWNISAIAYGLIGKLFVKRHGHIMVKLRRWASVKRMWRYLKAGRKLTRKVGCSDCRWDFQRAIRGHYQSARKKEEKTALKEVGLQTSALSRRLVPKDED